jgi:hypothetical protein
MIRGPSRRRPSRSFLRRSSGDDGQRDRHCRTHHARRRDAGAVRLKSQITVYAPGVGSSILSPPTSSIRHFCSRAILRLITIGAALITCLPTLTARAGNELSGDQMAVAVAVDTAMFAAEKCPGFRIVEGAIFANVQGVGVSKEQVLGQEWKDGLLLGEANAKGGYAKNPSEFCKRTWLMLGPPNHTFVKHQLLEKKQLAMPLGKVSSNPSKQSAERNN